MTDILSHKRAQLNAKMAELKIKICLNPVEKKSEFIPYQLTEYPGAVELIYIQWGLMGYFQFDFFQRYWHKLALGGIRVEIIAGYLHDQPNWTAVAEIIQARLKLTGF